MLTILLYSKLAERYCKKQEMIQRIIERLETWARKIEKRVYFLKKIQPFLVVSHLQ